MGLKSLKKLFTPVLMQKKISLMIEKIEYKLESPPSPKLSASTVLNSLIIYEYSFTDYKDSTIKVMYYSYADRLEVILNYDIEEDINIVVENEEASFETFEDITTSLFDRYIPVLGYTQKTVRSISLMKAHANKIITPMIVVGTDVKLETYINETMPDIHFLDLCRLHRTSNIAERMDVQAYNESKNKEQPRRKMPPREYEKLDLEYDYINYYLSIPDKNKIIPVIRIKLSDSASLDYAKKISQLSIEFKKVSLRIETDRENIAHIKSYLLPLASTLENVYIVLEEKDDDLKNTHNEIMALEKLSEDLKIIYLAKNINSIGSLTDNKDTLRDNSSLIKFKNLQPHHNELIYADYCGFEKDTAVEPTGFPARTARIFYTNIRNIDQYYLRRQREASNAWIDAMDSLQTHIVNPKLPYIQKEHCEACYDISTKTSRFSLGDMKENCVIHNGISIAMA